VLDAASLSVAAGEFVVALGPSGSGKTTLFRCLTRLAEPEAGEIYIGGAEYHSLRGRSLAPNLAERFADRVIEMRCGRLLGRKCKVS